MNLCKECILATGIEISGNIYIIGLCDYCYKPDKCKVIESEEIECEILLTKPS